MNEMAWAVVQYHCESFLVLLTVMGCSLTPYNNAIRICFVKGFP